jgi:8-oxo-dGTP pyrophosphatase MutT (NUDIX family)
LSELRTHRFTLTHLTRLSARLCDHDWIWARENADGIARNWARRLKEKPGLFDGPVLLACGCTIRDGACEAQLFETRYSRFIAFRDAGSPDESVANAFSAIVPHTADGALLLGQMGPHTANAGQVYFPCGTPDRDDVRDGGAVDLAGSAAREFREETGLPLPDDAEDAPWVLLRGEGQLAFLRPVRFNARADELIARAEGHRAREAEPELARLVVARGQADIDPARMPGFVRAYLESVLGA